MNDFIDDRDHADRIRQIERMRAVLDGERPYTVAHGKSERVMRTLPPNSIDAIVTDPPAGIGFMGKTWDKFDAPGIVRNLFSREGKGAGKGHSHGVARGLRARENFIAFMTRTMREALRVLKPGGYALVWAIPKTSHWTATACEDAGFEVIDRVSHFFGSGFPKNLNISKAIDKARGQSHKRKVIGKTNRNLGPSMGRGSYGGQQAFREKNWHLSNLLTAPATNDAAQWEGFGTALKPACEDWWLVRKPLEGTYVNNVLTYGTGVLNIDGCRITTTDNLNGGTYSGGKRNKMPGDERTSRAAGRYGEDGRLNPEDYVQPSGRWPAHLVFDQHAAEHLDVQAPVSKFFYVAKPSRREREEGLEGMRSVTAVQAVGRDPSSRGAQNARAGAGRAAGAPVYRCTKCDNRIHGGHQVQPCSKRKHGKKHKLVIDGYMPTVRNHHPTVKSIALMRWLCRLITPPRGVVLDAFNGSGTTGCAAVLEGFRYIGIDAERDYVHITRARLRHWFSHPDARQITAKEASLRVVRG